jgi:hypothetical protein
MPLLAMNRGSYTFFVLKCWNPWSASALFAIISLVARIASKGVCGSLRNRFKSPKSPPSANYDSRVCERGQGFSSAKPKVLRASAMHFALDIRSWVGGNSLVSICFAANHGCAGSVRRAEAEEYRLQWKSLPFAES